MCFDAAATLHTASSPVMFYNRVANAEIQEIEVESGNEIRAVTVFVANSL